MEITAKENAGIVLEKLLWGDLSPYETNSCHNIPNLARRTLIYYTLQFAEGIRNSFGNKPHSQFLKEFAKLHNCAITYGYRGYSHGKKNGIVDIKPTDIQLLEDYTRLLTPSVLGFHPLNAHYQSPVKVVAHIKSGDRLIGALDFSKPKDVLTVTILGLSNYTKRIKHK